MALKNSRCEQDTKGEPEEVFYKFCKNIYSYICSPVLPRNPNDLFWVQLYHTLFLSIGFKVLGGLQNDCEYWLFFGKEYT